MKIRFVGALGSVTGSCSLLNHRSRYYLVDCGAVQSGAMTSPGNWSGFGFKPDGISAVFLTHAHMDHCGLLPVLVREGFRGKVYCTQATADLARHALLDVAALGIGGFSAADVERLRFVCPDHHERFQFGAFFPVDQDLTCALIRTSHVLGAVGFEFQFADWNGASPNERKTIVFSGDVGCNTDENLYQSLLNDRQYPSTFAEYIVCESTYGAREREPGFMDYDRRMGALKRLLGEAVRLGPGATIIFPCFTLQRLQELLVDLHCVLDLQLTDEERRDWLQFRRGEAARIATVVVDSPLAMKYGPVFARELGRLRRNGKPFYRNSALPGRLRAADGEVEAVLASLFCARSGGVDGRNYSLAYCEEVLGVDAPLRVVVAGAGMCNGGRVCGHLKKLLPSPQTVVALTGYQADGTPGAELSRRANDPAAEIDGSAWELSSNQVRARIVDLAAFYSGHADKHGLLDFMLRKNSQHPHRELKRIFLVHGENAERSALKRAILARAGGMRPGDRSVGGVELPEPSSGWFDLLKNEWSYELHPNVDRTEQQVAVMQWKLRQIIEGQSGGGESSVALAAKQLLGELGGLAKAL